MALIFEDDYKKDEAVFFDYKKIYSKKIKLVKLEQKLEPEIKVKVPARLHFFNHYLSEENFLKNINNIQGKSFSSKQAVIKNLSNLNAKGAKNAIAYVIRNSQSDFAQNEMGEFVSQDEILNEWSKDFSPKENSKEIWHLAFCINETMSERNVNILKQSVKEVMQKHFSEYKYITVPHTHQNNPHIHIIINKNNIYTGKKLHLNNKEFKTLFNQMRNDFALCLNTRGLQYHNRFKLENDLELLKKNMAKTDFYSRKNLNLEIASLQEKIDTKIKTKEKDFKFLKKELDELNTKRKELLFTKIKKIDYKTQSKEEISTLYQSLKNLNQIICEKQRIKENLFKELPLLQKEFNALAWERKRYSEEFESLESKKRYVEFIEKNVRKNNLSKKDILSLREIKRDLLRKERGFQTNLEDNIKASLIVSTLLGKKNKAYDLITSYKELEKNLTILQKSSLEREVYEELEKKLLNNKKIITELINNRFDFLQNTLKTKKNYYLLKEYENLSLFLNKNNTKELENLFKEIKNPKLRKEKLTHHKESKEQKSNTINGNSSNSKQESKIFKNENIQELKQENNQVVNSLQNENKDENTLKKSEFSMKNLNEKELNAFVEFLVLKRKTQNKEFYTHFYKDKIAKNELENFKALYNEFLNIKDKNRDFAR